MRKVLVNIALIGALAAPLPLAAQDVGESSGNSGASRERGNGFDRRGLEISPYIEAAQVISAEITPGDDVVTYTQLAAGVDAGFGGRSSSGSVSLRYERRISYGDESDLDTVSGIARASVALIPQTLTFEAGGLASRTRLEGNGQTSVGAFGNQVDSTTQIYSVFAGPSFQTREGPVELSAAYQAGYTRVESPDALVLAPGEAPVDIFDDSIVHNANARAGLAPGTVLPVGVGIGGGWNRQDIGNLDQRVDNKFVRGDVTLPLSPTLALVGGVGYEDVTVSSRDAVVDGLGNPVIGSDGRFVTDDGAPRQIAFETDGLIWDVGVMWRPSSRTSLSATVGRRYGSTTYYGNLSYAPSARTNINVGVYDSLNAFGGQLTNNLNALGTNFQAFRNPISGDLSGCVAGEDGSNCTLAGIGSLRSAVFRNRGVTASLGRNLGRTNLGFGLGYDRRAFIAAQGTVLASLNDVVEENYWISAFASRELDRRSGVNFATSATWFESGLDNTGDGFAYSANASYYRNIIAGLTGTAAVGLDGISRDQLDEFAFVSALLGLRYTF